MEVNKELITHVANTARLTLTDDEIEQFVPQIKEILETFSKLDEVDTKGIEPSFQPFPLKNAFREDKVEPSLSQKFTLELQDLFLRQTNLNLTNAGGDLHFEGEITEYRIVPIAATAEQTAAQSRLTVGVRVRFFNRLQEEDNFEQTFSFYSDYDANVQLIGAVLDTAYEEIFQRITQDIFNAAVAKW